MKETKFGELLKTANKFYNNRIEWHFHMLTPACTFNDSDKFSIILENDETKESWIASFDKKPVKEGEQLEKLFYGRV